MNEINTGDTGFMMICAALVLFMTPGLAFFYGGLVQSKTLSIHDESFAAMGVVAVQCALGIFAHVRTKRFTWRFCGRTSSVGLGGVGLGPNPGLLSEEIPHSVVS